MRTITSYGSRGDEFGAPPIEDVVLGRLFKPPSDVRGEAGRAPRHSDPARMTFGGPSSAHLSAAQLPMKRMAWDHAAGASLRSPVRFLGGATRFCRMAPSWRFDPRRHPHFATGAKRHASHSSPAASQSVAGVGLRGRTRQSRAATACSARLSGCGATYCASCRQVCIRCFSQIATKSSRVRVDIKSFCARGSHA